MIRFYSLEEKLPPTTATLLGLQHVLAMFVGICTPPLIIAGALKLSPMDAAFLISMALFTSGFTTFIQVRQLGPLGSGMLSVQGTSFVFVPLAIQAGAIGGLPLIFGMALAASPLEMLVSRSIGLAQRLFPPVVTGAVVMLIGMSLIKVGITDLAGGFGASDFGSPANLALGTFVMITIVLLNRYGSGLLRTLAIALGLLAGYMLAAVLGRVDFSLVGRTGWIMLPHPARYGLQFHPGFLLPWMIGYLITSIECIGDLTATSAVSRQPVVGPIFVRRLQGGVLADGVGCFLSALLNAMPTTTFAQNNGVIAMTGVASRRVGVAVAWILMLLGLFPKLAAVISLVPKPVLGGATVIMFAMVAVAGLHIIVSGGFGTREQFILSLTLALGMGVTMVPEVTHQVGKMAEGSALGMSLQIVLESGLTVGALTAILLHQILPQDGPEEESG